MCCQSKKIETGLGAGGVRTSDSSLEERQFIAERDQPDPEKER
jgi:hypothetical protein